MYRHVTLLAATVAAMSVSLPLLAHHNFSETYETAKPGRLDGTIVDVQWSNPHALLTVSIVNPGTPAESTIWTVELSPPNAMVRMGWTPAMLGAGTAVVVDGFPARDGTRRFGSSALTLKATGQRVELPMMNWQPAGAPKGAFGPLE